jgi:N-methylhydantoinase B
VNNVAAGERSGMDLITQELIKSQLSTIADEIAIRLMRTAISGVIRDILDFSTALCDRHGRMITQGFSLPVHLGSIGDAIQAVIDRFGDNLNPGDVVILNDPFHGGMHLPDVFMVRPMFVDRQLVGYAVVVAHQADIGGRVPGGSAADSTEIFQEGLRLPPTRWYRDGELVEDINELIRLNVRLPDTVTSDLGAQLAGCLNAEIEFARLVRRYGLAELERYIDGILDYSELMCRTAIAEWPDGVYEFTDYEDHDGLSETSVKISVKVTIAGDSIHFDFAGTNPQVAGAINATPASVKGAVYTCVRSLIGYDIANNGGYVRPISLSIPLGSVLNAQAPAACAARGVVVFRTIDAVLGALAQALPDKVPAANEGGTTGLRFGGYRDGAAFQVNDIICGSWGARPYADGLDGVSNFAGNIACRPIEILEAEDPIRVTQFEYSPDSGGAGQFRGGLALIRELEYLGPRAVLQVRTHRRTIVPYGLSGGRAGSGSLTYLRTADGSEELLPTKITRPIEPGSTVRHITASAIRCCERPNASRRTCEKRRYPLPMH